ncbi:SHD1 domain-containing protein [Pontiella agarivorans]|uniref:SHD1 domain-containing protein n=1 Tax=Pontiella agarivorans TaxID=3038953 RepID=A0ABU5MUD4_9BACT|nr:SHD1 domain-containing protein [Pontiella agarivorans]MDZ8117819.1 SHD1 domain-containing protein [Pontiella agarivorans]
MDRKTKGVVKGAPSGLVISLAVHAGAFLLAGILVVFTVHQKEEKKFVPPKPLDRPKMKLKKPKVKVKKSAKPKPTTRIVTKVKRAKMPDIQLPEMSGMADGLAGGIGNFEIMPDLGELTLLGSKSSIGNDLEGTFYDVKRDRRGRPIPVDTGGDEWRQLIRKFFLSGWKTSTFSRYYRAPQKLYATTLVVPVTLSGIAPEAFGDDDAVGALWMVHYKGQLVNKDSIKFRFWGIGDEFIVVRVDGTVVMGAYWPHASMRDYVMNGIWESSSMDSDKYYWGNNKAVVGDWIELEAGEPKEIEILIGDNGGQACFLLGVQEEGMEYERSGQPSPILPAFKTAELPHNLCDVIYKELPQGDVCLTNGPVFNDYASRSSGASRPDEVEAEALPDTDPESVMRIWNLVTGKSFEAEYIAMVGGNVVFKTAGGKTSKVPLQQLSAGDREFVELLNPPVLDLNFTRKMQEQTFTEGYYGTWPRPPVTRARFGVRIKQTSAGDYNHELRAQIYAVGQQRTRPEKKYVLLDRQQVSFSLTKENKRSYEFLSEREEILTSFDVSGEPRGEKYYGYLVVVRDARDQIVAVDASNDWLLDHIGRVEKLAVGMYFDKDCIRTFPGRPRPILW